MGSSTPPVETNTRKVIARLERDGWRNIGGGNHDKYVHADRPAALITVPRHREMSPGVAKSIARTAGWI